MKKILTSMVLCITLFSTIANASIAFTEMEMGKMDGAEKGASFAAKSSNKKGREWFENKLKEKGIDWSKGTHLNCEDFSPVILNIMNNSLKNYEQIKSKNKFEQRAAFVYNKERADYVFKQLGIKGDISIKSPVSGVTYSFSADDYATNLNEYILHIKNSNDIKLMYQFIANVMRISKTQIRNMNANVQDLPKYSSLGYGFYKSIEVLDAFDISLSAQNLIERFYRDGYQGREKFIGYNSNMFQKWLGFVLTQDFDSADEQLRKIKYKPLVNWAKIQCNYNSNL